MKQDVILNDEQIRDRAAALAQTIETMSDLKFEQKQINKEYKDRLDALEKEAFRLARIVRTHQEEMDVEPPLLTLTSRENN
jgi:aminopeptidase C